MAQRTIHYLFGETLAAKIQLRDKNRFLLGSILPDAAAACDRDRAHYKTRTDTHIYYDFEAFRKQYFDRMQQDDLYLGYYMHLLEDAFYRAFIYEERFTMPHTKEEVALLHNDYHILNAYIVKKYGIRNTLQTNAELPEPIRAIADFHTGAFLGEMAADFTEQPEGVTVFLTEAMLDEFIETYAPLAAKELTNVKNGTPALQAADYAWLRKR